MEVLGTIVGVLLIVMFFICVVFFTVMMCAVIVDSVKDMLEDWKKIREVLG